MILLKILDENIDYFCRPNNVSMDRYYYSSPNIKYISWESGMVLCLSGGTQTEGYTISSNSYDEDDWE